jgi:hypothetical protein
MTQFEGQPQPAQSAFNQRADTAALNLKDQLGRELSAQTGQQVVLPPTPVPVNDEGNPVGAPPPEGSYARQAYDQQQQQRAMDYQREAAQQAYAPGAPTPAPTQEPPQPPEQTSQRAQERITSLVSQLRTKDQEFQQLQQSQSQNATTVEELRAKLTAQEQMMNQVMQQNLENLDPETRAQVMADARIGQAVAASEQRILAAVQPQLQTLQDRNHQLEKSRLSGRYQGYDPGVHDVLIDEFRRANPNCSVEQAFRASATPEELSVGGLRPANAPPPALPPGSGSTAPRYIPTPNQQEDPVQQIRDDAARAAELARSTDPQDQKAATQLWHKNLADRLGM